MRILGLDPGSRFTGYGLIERRGSKLNLITQGRIALPSSEALALRLAELSSEVQRLLRLHQPDVAVLETLFRGVNPRSLIVLAQARGALLATLASHELPIHEYTPAEIKSAVTGNGRADKQQVSRMVQLILGHNDQRLSPDASDALAVGICFAQRFRLDRLGAAKASGRRG